MLTTLDQSSPSLAQLERIVRRAYRLRSDTLRMITKARASHVGSCLSIAEILACLYGEWLRVTPGSAQSPERDYFFLSKGHAAAIYYAALAECGFIPQEQLASYCNDGSSLAGHVTKNTDAPGIELSFGSLGHGLSVGCGVALDCKLSGSDNRVVVVLSDGELDEGSCWEAILFAGHHHLHNLRVFVDYNKIQSYGSVEEVLDLAPLADKLRAFRWEVTELDGHDPRSILAFLHHSSDKAQIAIAHTIKGKGVSFMENELLWHYRNPSEEQFADAQQELDRRLEDALQLLFEEAE